MRRAGEFIADTFWLLVEFVCEFWPVVLCVAFVVGCFALAVAFPNGACAAVPAPRPAVRPAYQAPAVVVQPLYVPVHYGCHR